MSATCRLATLALLCLLAACASVTHTTREDASGATAEGSPYVAEPGRDAAMIAQMRAAPAPATPELVPGKNASGDLNRLAAQGFVRIGSARYALDQTAARDEALRQGQRVGADRVLLYAPEPSAPNAWTATYFVRFKLPFGASFRDLSAEERSTLGSDGVQIGSVVGGTPASRANLLGGDFVIKFDGKPVANKASFQNLLRANAGHPVTLTVLRNGETLQRVVRLEAVPSASGH